MSTALVVILGGKVNQDIIEVAKQHVTGTDMELLICNFIDKERYQGDLERSARTGKEISSIEELENSTREQIREDVDDILGAGIPHSTVSVVGSIPEDIIETAREHDCDHIFIAGKRRSPAGKAVFGDTAQRVILYFEGPVTVTTS